MGQYRFMPMKIICDNPEYKNDLSRISETLFLEPVSGTEKIPEEEVYLSFDEGGLSLRSGSLSYRGDFSEMERRVRNGLYQHELLVKAAKLKEKGAHPLALDLTAGMGNDAFLLAAAGFQVIMIEHDPVIAALLRDALRRGRKEEALSGIISRMTLLEGDSLQEIAGIPETPDIIYLDPMFPERKKTGLVKKKFQLLHKLEKPCENGEELLWAALRKRPQRVIIKRPANGPTLGGMKPDWSLQGGQIRYDVFTRKGETHG